MEDDRFITTISQHPSKELKKKVELALNKYRESLCKVGTETAPLFFGEQLTSGISINQIASNCIIIKCPSQIVEMGLSSRVHASEIFDIVQQIIIQHMTTSMHTIIIRHINLQLVTNENYTITYVHKPWIHYHSLDTSSLLPVASLRVYLR